MNTVNRYHYCHHYISKPSDIPTKTPCHEPNIVAWSIHTCTQIRTENLPMIEDQHSVAHAHGHAKIR